MRILTRGEWAFLACILVYSFIPAGIGLLRIPELFGGPAVIPVNPRAVIDPVPIGLHIVGSSLFVLLGALQFLPSIRRSNRAFHRNLGRVVAAAGCVSALSGLWMTVFYPFPDALQGPLLHWARISLSLAMLGFIVWGVVAIRSRDAAGHRASMVRAYAIGQGASTQTALFLIAMSVFGVAPLGFERDLMMVAAWAINIAVAEILIRLAFATRKVRAATGGMP